MARTFDGSSQYLSVASTLLGNEPIGMIVWANPDNITASVIPLGLGNNGASGNFFLQYAGATASDPVRAIKDNDAGSGSVIAATTAGYSAATWSLGAAMFLADNSRDVFLNGANKGSETTSRTDPTPDFISVGALRRNSIVQPFDGALAEAFFFDVAVTDAQQALFAAGVHPIDACVPIANIRAWYPLMRDDNNRIGGGYPNLTATGSPTFSSHPPDPIYPRIGGLLCL